MISPYALEKLPEWFHVRDLNLNVVWATDAARAVFGWNDGNDSPAPSESLHHCAAAALSQGAWSGRLAIADASGRIQHVESRWCTLYDDAGVATGFFIMDRDAEARMAEEENLLRAQRMESIATLAGGMAHDINNVLGPILMASEMIQTRVEDPWVQKKLAVIEESARRGADVVRQVLDFSRGAQGKKIAVQTRHLLKELVEFAGHSFSKTISIEGDFPRDLPLVTGDVAQLRQAILNLMVNAGDAMPDGGTMRLSAASVDLSSDEAAALSPNSSPGAFVRISVQDSGSGVSPEQEDRIFEPFYTTKSRGQGTGLGLSTTLSIVKGHGGFMSLDSRSGEGSVFSILLPHAVGHSGEPKNSEPVSVSGRFAQPTILIVDDEPMMLEVNIDLLTFAGCKVLSASNGQEGLEAFRAQPAAINLVITDINMPIMDGPTMIRELRAERPDLPVLAVSGLAELNDLPQGGELGEIPVLHKPYTNDELLQAISGQIGPLESPTMKRTPTGNTMSDQAFDQLMGGDW